MNCDDTEFSIQVKELHQSLVERELARLGYDPSDIWVDWDMHQDGIPYIFGFFGAIYNLGELVKRHIPEDEVEMLIKYISMRGLYLFRGDMDIRFEIESDGVSGYGFDPNMLRSEYLLRKFHASITYEINVLAEELSKKVFLMELDEMMPVKKLQ
ncbi:ABC-type dipeptide transporter, periplasmic component [Thiohalobacter thiocyanaticus]|uniref:ABC-type dipeptide transporter, periplasmic component n=1 Tax=Thiohalobacter thiocyanaticus TaxID=585455 RepID=A0A1Z4VSK8_9GAMM|nr:hypothetical protein [Thiohalobacter thiocyanaticus]BAZ94616.1 ABC-type dipeptide transporter, periplasmic component [Thiohalobacter thiocyanaticus]